MASDAKIGLLLGLVVIFLIAFVINGLPRFGDAKESNELAKIVDRSHPGIKPEIPPEVLPPERVPKRSGKETPPSDSEERVRDSFPGTPETNDRDFKPVKPTFARAYYVVSDGDNLADIAKRFYGSEEGNRRVNVIRIFEANRKLLESPDKIYPGQKLIIPPLWASDSDKSNIEDIFPDSMFERVDSIGRRHL